MSEATADRPQPAQLPPAPSSLAGPDGAPQFGLFSGGLADAGFGGLRAPWAATFIERRLIEKKRQYVLVTTPDAMLCLAIVDTGYLASGFCGVFDRGSRRLLANENPVFPSISAQINDRPGDGLSARLIGLGVNARIQRRGAELTVRATWGAAEVDLTLDTSRAPAPMTAIAPIGAGRFDLTQ